MRKEHTRLFLALVLLILLTEVCSLGTTLWATEMARQAQIQQAQSDAALAAIELSQRSELSLEEILSVLSTSAQRLSVESEAQLPGEIAEQARSGRVVFSAAQHETFFMLEGTLCAVHPAPLPLLPRMVAVYLLLSGLGLTLLALILGRLAAGRLARPVAALSEAAQRVAQGDFSVRVPQQRDMSKQMGELTENFNAMTEALSSVEYLRRDFTSNVSHEIKTPVAAIHSYAQLLLTGGATEEAQRGYVEAIARESRHLSNLSDSLLRLTRLESASAPLKPARYRVDEQLRGIAAALLPAMEEKQIALDADIPDAAAFADEELMAQVYFNILGNAVKFTPAGGEIGVSLRRTPEQLTVCVRDTGCGMDEETMRHIFEKFYQGDGSHATQGVGLGLALADKIVRLHGGRIEVQSEPGKGSIFTVVLPQKA